MYVYMGPFKNYVKPKGRGVRLTVTRCDKEGGGEGSGYSYVT